MHIYKFCVIYEKLNPTLYNRGTYFVEYRFPVVTSRDTHKCTEYEVTRVASKKILNQCECFITNH